MEISNIRDEKVPENSRFSRNLTPRVEEGGSEISRGRENYVRDGGAEGNSSYALITEIEEFYVPFRNLRR